MSGRYFMKKLIFALCIAAFILGAFLISRSVQMNDIKECLNYRYPNETFSIESVSIDIKSKEIVARVRDAEGVEATIRKKGGTVDSDYESVKAKSLVEYELTEVLRKNELLKYIASMDVKIFGRIEYSEIADDMDPKIYLTIAYNDKISGKSDFAQLSHDVISSISKAKYNNIDTYVFVQNTEQDVLNLVVYPEDSGADVDALLDKVEVVKESKLG